MGVGSESQSGSGSGLGSEGWLHSSGAGNNPPQEPGGNFTRAQRTQLSGEYANNESSNKNQNNNNYKNNNNNNNDSSDSEDDMGMDSRYGVRGLLSRVVQETSRLQQQQQQWQQQQERSVIPLCQYDQLLTYGESLMSLMTAEPHGMEVDIPI